MVGANVTFTRTGGVLVTGLLISTSASLGGDRLINWLGLVSGLLVTTTGDAPLTGCRQTSTGPAIIAVTALATATARVTTAGTPTSGGRHSWAWASPAAWCPAPQRWSSRSALVVLLGAVALNRPPSASPPSSPRGSAWALTLTAAGLLIARARRGSADTFARCTESVPGHRR